MLVVIRDPVFQCSHQVEGTGPFREPEALFLQGAHDALGIGVPLGVVSAGKRLMDS